jgi:AraC family transcriptional regulator
LTPSHHVRTLFKSNLFQVLDYRCSGHRERQEEWSTDHEIILPRAGSYVRKDPLGELVADPNQILFSHKDQPYDIRHPLKREDRSTVILLNPPTLLEIASSFEASVADHPSTPFPLPGIPADQRLQLSQYWLLRAASPDPFPEPLAVEEGFLALIAEILARVFSAEPEPPLQKLPATAREHRDLVQRVKLILNAHFNEKLLLDQIASLAYSSPFHLSRVFKRHTGLTIHQYRQRLRLVNAAERMAENPDEGLDRIALDYGFANHSHFTTAFGKTFHLPPSDFRASATSHQLQWMSKILKV